MQSMQNKKERIFEISNAKAGYFKEYCRSFRIPTIISQHDNFKRFICFMDEDELFKAKLFCDVKCKPEAKRQNMDKESEMKQKISVFIIIEETR